MLRGGFENRRTRLETSASRPRHFASAHAGRGIPQTAVLLTARTRSPLSSPARPSCRWRRSRTPQSATRSRRSAARFPWLPSFATLSELYDFRKGLFSGCVALSILAAIAGGCAGLEPPGSGPTGASDRGPPPSAAPSPVRRAERIGRSVRGRTIRATAVGAPHVGRKVLVVGCIHGTECAGMAITRALLTGPAPKRSELWVLPDLNPDGHRRGARVNARGVDLNRNFPSEWRPIGLPGDPEYAGSRPLSEPEPRAAARLVRRVRPDLTIWFHQPQDVVRAWGRSVGPARRYADRAGAPFRALPWLTGTAPNWQNRRFRSGASFVVELPPGSLPAEAARRHVDAVRSFAP